MPLSFNLLCLVTSNYVLLLIVVPNFCLLLRFVVHLFTHSPRDGVCTAFRLLLVIASETDHSLKLTVVQPSFRFFTNGHPRLDSDAENAAKPKDGENLSGSIDKHGFQRNTGKPMDISRKML